MAFNSKQSTIFRQFFLSIPRFVHRPIQYALAPLFKDPTFYANSKYFRKEFKSEDGIIKDIYDGKVNQKHCVPITNVKGGHSLIFESDGVSPYGSGSSTFWPIFLAVNELPKSLRFLFRYMLCIGCWSGSAPDFNVFLSPFLKEIKDLYEKGVTLKTPKGKSIVVKAIIAPFTCDLSAKSKIFGTIGFGGFFGCLQCKNHGEKLTAKRFYYPTSVGEDEDVSELNKRRTDAEMRQLADDLSQDLVELSEDELIGMKYRTILFDFPVFEFVSGQTWDWMHGFCLGIFKTIMLLMFLSNYSKEKWYLEKVIHILQKRSKALKN